MLRVYKGNIYDLAYVSAQVILDTTSIPKIAGADFVEINGTKAPINAQIDGELSTPTYIHLFNLDNLGTRKIKFYFDKQVSLYPWYNPLVGDEIKSSFDPVEQCYVFEINANSPIIQTFGDLEVVFLVGTDCTLYRVSVYDPNAEYHRDFGQDFFRSIQGRYERLMIKGIGGIANPYLCFKTSDERAITVKQYGRGYAEIVDQLIVQPDESGFYKTRVSPDAWHIELYDNDQMPTGDPFEFTYLSVHANSTQAPNFEYFDDFLSAEVIEEKKILSDDLPIDCFNAEFYADEGETLSLSVGDKLTLVSNNKVFGRFTIKTVERTYAGTYQVVAYNKFYELDNIPFYGIVVGTMPIVNADSGKTKPWDDVSRVFTNNGISVDFSSIGNLTKSGISGVVPLSTLRFLLCAISYSHNKFIVINRETDEIQLVSLKESGRISEIKYIHNEEDVDDPANSIEKIIGEATFERLNLSRGEWSYSELTTGESSDYFYFDITSGNTYVFGGENEAKEYRISTSTGEGLPYEELWTSPYALVIKATRNSKLTMYTNAVTIEKRAIYASSNNVSGEIYNSDKFGCYGYVNARDTEPYYTMVDRKPFINHYVKNHGKVTAKIILDKETPEKVGDYVCIQTAHEGDKYGYITKMQTVFGYDDISNIEIETYDIPLHS